MNNKITNAFIFFKKINYDKNVLINCHISMQHK